MRILPLIVSVPLLMGSKASLERSYELADAQASIATLTMSLKFDPRNPEIYLMRAELFSEINDLRSAIEDYSKALSLQPHSLTFANRGYLRQVQGDHAGAIADLSEAIKKAEKSKDTAVLLMHRAESRFEQGDFPGALLDLNKAAQLDPQFWDLYELRARTHYELGNLPEAIADYSEALNAGQDVALLGSRAYLQMLHGDYEGAIWDYTQAIQIDRQDVELYVQRADAKIKAENFEGALPDLTRAIHLDPHRAEFYSQRGFVRMNMQDIKGALSDYSVAIKLNEQHDPSYYHRGLLRVQEADYAGALMDFARAIQLNPEPRKYYVKRGWAQFQLGDYQGAVDDYTRAIGPESEASVFYYRGLAYKELGQEAKAISDFSQSLILNPLHEKALRQRALSFEILGKKRLALKDYSRLSEIGKVPEEALFQRARVWQSLGEYRKAAKDYQSILKQPIREIDLFTYDPQLVSVHQRVQGRNDKTIICLKDQNRSYAAQKANAQVLELLLGRDRLSLLLQDQSFGPVLSEQIQVDSSVQAMLNSGAIRASEYLLLSNPLPLSIYGVADAKLEDKVKEFGDLIGTYDSAAKGAYRELMAMAEQVARRQCSEAIWTFWQKHMAYKRGELKLNDYALQMIVFAKAKGLDLKPSPQLRRLDQVVLLEQRIVFPKVDGEREDLLINHLSDWLTAEEVQRLGFWTNAYESSVLKPGAYDQLIVEKAREKTLDVARLFPNFTRYAQYLSDFEGLNREKLKDELFVLLKEALLAHAGDNPAQQEILQILYHLELLEALFQLNVSAEQWDYYRDHKRLCSWQSIMQQLNAFYLEMGFHSEAVENLKILDYRRKDIQKFYEALASQARKMHSRAFKTMQQEGQNRVILLCDPKLVPFLEVFWRDKSWSYLVLNAKVSKAERSMNLHL